MLDWDELHSVELKGDNLRQFLSDWQTTILSINGLPDAKFLEPLFRKQLDQSEQLKNAMAFTGRILINVVRASPTTRSCLF